MSEITPHLPDDESSKKETGKELLANQKAALAKPLEPKVLGALEQRDDELNLREYWQVIAHRKWTVLTFFMVVVITTLIASFLATPIYRASLTLQIERDLPKVVKFQDVTPVESGAADKDFYQTQYELLKSRTLAKRTMDQLSLATTPAFMDKHAGGVISGLMQTMGVKSSSETQANDIVANFLQDLVISPVKQSRLVEVSFESYDPELSAKVVNTLAENFIEMNLERRIDASSYAKSFLEDRLTQVKVKLEDSEKKLIQFARTYEIIKVDENRTIQLQKLREVTLALTEAEKERLSAETLYRSSQRNSGHSLEAVLNSEVISRLKQTQAELEASYQEKLKVFKPNYPAMLQLKEQISEIEAKIESEVDNIRGSIRSNYEIAKQKESKLGKQLTKLKDEVLSIQDRSIEYNILQREVDTNRELYEGLLQRMKEVGVAGGVTTNNISIVDAAYVPHKKYKPRISINLLLAIIIGLVGGVGFAFFFEHLDDTIKLPQDLERKMHVPLLGIVPEVKSARVKRTDNVQLALMSATEPRSGFAEAYRSVRTSLLFATSSGAPKILLFTSPGPSEGKTTSALNVAITFTQTGSKVLLVDTDLRNPSMHRLLGLDNTMGLTNFLAGDAQPAQVSQATEVADLFAIPSGPLPPNPAELLSGGKMAELLLLAREKFDYVILDGPPVLGLADALVLANIAQSTVIVVEAGVTRQGHLSGALKRLKSIHASIVGGVMAKYKETTGAYGYHSSYYYYQSEDHQEPKKLA